MLGLFLAGVIFILSQCGGGDNKSPAPAASRGSGTGRVAASVVLTGRVAGRTADQSAGQVALTITISGIYSADNTAFNPIVAQETLDIAAGQTRVTVLNVPIGINHLLVVHADWGNGAVETVKAIIPEVNES